MDLQTYLHELEAVKKKPKKSKHRNIRTPVDGLWFDSKIEAARYQELKLLQRVGEIKWFIWQVPFLLAANIKYKADFLVVNNDGSIDIEDVKGFDKKSQKFRSTPVFKMKQKLMREAYGIEIKIT